MNSYLAKKCCKPLMLVFALFASSSYASSKQPVKALYIPLADHYAAVVAYERYRHQMQHADFQILQMKSWDLLRAYFRSQDADMAFVMSPLAMDMYSELGNLRWIGLMHRDGNALAINNLIKQQVNLAPTRIDRKPNAALALAMQSLSKDLIRPLEIAVPHVKSTHSVVLYHYFKQHGVSMGLDSHDDADVFVRGVAPPKAPLFIKAQSSKGTPAAFEQSLPWADVVETQGFGHVAWYSKDVLPWDNGHVECITLVKDSAINNKYAAVNEVNFYLHKAGADIEAARKQGGDALQDIVKIITKHIPLHTPEAIVASLNPQLNVINYHNLNVDKPGLALIMNTAVEAGIINHKINIDEFADERFQQNNIQQANFQKSISQQTKPQQTKVESSVNE